MTTFGIEYLTTLYFSGSALDLRGYAEGSRARLQLKGIQGFQGDSEAGWRCTEAFEDEVPGVGYRGDGTNPSGELPNKHTHTHTTYP
jgi:hypothetical protein